MAYPPMTLIASGAVFSNLQLDGLSGHMERLLKAQVASVTPTAAATVASFTTVGGLLAAGGYYLNFTETNAFGETAPSTESSVFTVATAQIYKVTLPALQTNNLARNIYLTGANGATGSEVKYLTGVTATTAFLSAAATTGSGATAMPKASTTGPGGDVVRFVRSWEDNRPQEIYNRARQVVYTFLAGDPVNEGEVIANFQEAHAAIATLYTAMNEIGTLIDANPGTIAPITTGIGGIGFKRTWP